METTSESVIPLVQNGVAFVTDEPARKSNVEMTQAIASITHFCGVATVIRFNFKFDTANFIFYISNSIHVLRRVRDNFYCFSIGCFFFLFVFVCVFSSILFSV